MSLDTALRLTELLLAFAFIQQSLEHLHSNRKDAALFVARIILCVIMALGIETNWVCLALMLTSLLILRRFQGPYNGGCDRMSLLILSCLTIAQFMPTPKLRELAIGYLAIQLVLSYFMSGWVKIVNPDWRSGRALQDVFAFSAYPVSEDLRRLAGHPRLLCAMSWAVMLFELAFPFALLNQQSLILALAIAALFHTANACLFGLNRFVWAWLAAYPAIIWLQARLF